MTAANRQGAPRRATVSGIEIGVGRPLALIAGPCVIEKEDLMMRTAETLKGITGKLGIPFIFKSSYEKDNRSSAEFFRGPGLHEGLALLAKIKQRFGVPVTSDVHREADVAAAAEVAPLLGAIAATIGLAAYVAKLESLADRIEACLRYKSEHCGFCADLGTPSVGVTCCAQGGPTEDGGWYVISAATALL